MALEQGVVEGDDDAAEAKWHRVDALPEVAFDHDDIIGTSLRKLLKVRLKKKLSVSYCFRFATRMCTIHAQDSYDASIKDVLPSSIDYDQFRKTLDGLSNKAGREL